MANPFMFGVTTEKLTRAEIARRRRIAAKHDCVFFGAEGRHWFATKGPGMGSPFDEATKRAVMSEVAR